MDTYDVFVISTNINNKEYFLGESENAASMNYLNDDSYGWHTDRKEAVNFMSLSDAQEVKDSGIIIPSHEIEVLKWTFDPQQDL